MILINDEILFVHVPRTGGNYFKYALMECGQSIKSVSVENGKYIPSNNKKNQCRIHSNLKYETDYKTLSFIRNPFSWYVSYYLMMLSATKLSFEEVYSRIPKYDKLIERMHGNVDKILRHDNLINEIEKYFGIEMPKFKINTRLNNNKYDEYYNEKLYNYVIRDSRNIIEKYNFKFGEI